MRKKRALPTPLRPENNSAIGEGDVNGRQIHRLGEDPSLQTLTPRSLAKSVAELDALRSRVLELEQQLSKHQIEALTASKTGKRLPPLNDTLAYTNGEGMVRTGTWEVLYQVLPTRSMSTSIPLGALTAIKASVPNPVCQDTTSIPATAIAPDVVDTDGTLDVDPAFTADTSGVDGSLSWGKSHHKRQELDLSQLVPTHREQTKITIGDADAAAAVTVSQRQRLYQILKRVSTLVTIAEDEVRLVLLKKLVDAEIGDIIKFLLDMETEQSVPVIREKLVFLIQNGSPSKHRRLVRPELSSQHPEWGIQYPLRKIAQNLEHLRSTSSNSDAAASSPSSSPSKKTDVIVLVSSGAYNPIHMLHIRAFYVARQYVESNYKFPVVGAFISPSHDTYVRVKNRRNPREMITKRHRLALIETAVAASSWIEVDKWEITRRRVLDYLSTLSHVRETCETHFPQFRFHVMYVCGCNTVVKLSHSALREDGFGCITVCRPTQIAMVVKHLGKTLAKTTTVIEDTGVLPCDLERATSFRVRQALTSVEANASMIEMMVGKPVFQYLVKHEIGRKIAGKENWSDDDKQWRGEDLAYVEYSES
ncbi:hypothetical protein BBJ28_00006904 [Nothophytophthora sp. Chile5]|nr:hypothetical protein BBJ28_00006904 [Nothophytophthora sp. Chile5]